MCGRIHQRAFVVLTMDFDQGRAQAFEGLCAERLIIDEGARASVGELNAPQDEVVFGRHVVFRHDGARRVPGGEFEGRSHLPLLRALTYQGSIAARPERKREGIEQDGFAGASLSGEYG